MKALPSRPFYVISLRNYFSCKPPHVFYNSDLIERQAAHTTWPSTLHLTHYSLYLTTYCTSLPNESASHLGPFVVHLSLCVGFCSTVNLSALNTLFTCSTNISSTPASVNSLALQLVIWWSCCVWSACSSNRKGSMLWRSQSISSFSWLR